MGLPCTPAYIIAITIGGPALMAMGCDTLSTHLFVFYFAILAGITPPVCVPAYCAASIAKSKPLETGFEAFKLAIVGFLIPYIFIYNDALLMRGTVGEIATVVMGLILTMICITSSFSGYLFDKINISARMGIALTALAGAVLCAMPDVINMWPVRIVLICLLSAFMLKPFIRRKKKAAASVSQTPGAL
jgi:TRAP-type uncharacterized transport system fused permease subunit